MINRRLFCASLASLLPALKAASRQEFLVYFGTYTRNKSKGIYVSRFDASQGKLTLPELAGESVNPSFVTLHPSGRFLYAANETGSFQGQRTGYVSGFSVDRASGKLTALNQASSRGSSPCHVVVDRKGQCLFVANYGSGSIAGYPLGKDGSIEESSAFVQQTGSGPNQSRQSSTHAHEVVVTADNRFLLVPDLGADSVFIYRLDAAKGTVTPNDPPAGKLPPGSGPRHLAIHPKGRFIYVISEIASTMTVFSWDGVKGVMTQLQNETTLPKDFSGTNSTAEVEVHPNGRFLYGSNRGHDSIVVYSIDPAKGTITYVEHASTLGKGPRNFAIDPTGAFLLAANERTDNVVVFAIDQKTGKLTPTGQTLEVGAPVAIIYLPVA